MEMMCRSCGGDYPGFRPEGAGQPHPVTFGEQRGKGEEASNSRKDAMTDMTSGTPRTGLTGRSAASTAGDGPAPAYGTTAATERPRRRLSTEPNQRSRPRSSGSTLLPSSPS